MTNVKILNYYTPFHPQVLEWGARSGQKVRPRGLLPAGPDPLLRPQDDVVRPRVGLHGVRPEVSPGLILLFSYLVLRFEYINFLCVFVFFWTCRVHCTSTNCMNVCCCYGFSFRRCSASCSCQTGSWMSWESSFILPPTHTSHTGYTMAYATVLDCR